ncbi:MAG: hemolysin family protein [Alphaproteobacteria bacterium]|jgi:CBS domain containing-hemolysin-like protein|nr:hemolysin family protein [Alphaproteobacteria bacterium]
MANTDDTETASEPPQRRRGGLGGILRQVLEAFGETPDLESPNPEAAELARHAHEFTRMDVGDVMTNRSDIQAIEISAPFEDVVARFLETEHSRLPVYRETLDDPVGVIHIKDIFRLMASGRSPETGAVLRTLKREGLYVPESMPAAALLEKMQSSRVHLALVIDEHGGVSGLVTLEDLLEAVVGDIDDEHDEAQVSGVIARPGGIYEVDARTDLDNLEAALEVERLTPEEFGEDFDTVGGLVTGLAGQVPQIGDIVSHPEGWTFEVLDADQRRVIRVRVRKALNGAAG